MLLISFKCLSILLRQTLIDRTIFEGLDAGDLTVNVVCDNLEAVEQEGLTHHVKV